MDFSATYLIAVPITTFCYGKSYTFSYSDLCFGILEVHYIFRLYHVWHGTGIWNKFFSVMVLIWCFRDKKFIVDYVFCEIFCSLFFWLFPLVEILFFAIFHISIIAFLFIVFILVVPWFLFLDSPTTVFLGMSGFFTVMTFWYVFTFSMPALFLLVHVPPTSRAGNLVLVFYIEGFFIFSWSSWSWLFVHLV